MHLKEMSLCRSFIVDVNAYAIKMGAPPLSNSQLRFVTFCVGAMALFSCLNFSAFAVASLGFYGDRALSWMLHYSKIDWSKLLKAGVVKVLVDHKISSVHLIIDDTDRPRCKTVRVLWAVFKTLDKVTGGWIQAQNIVFLCLVTDKITVPVLFSFYRPDPAYKAWKKKDKELRKKKVNKKSRPPEPKRNKRYPTRIEIATKLLMRFKTFMEVVKPLLLSDLKVKSISFDCAFLSPKIARSCKKIFPKIQVISQITSNQIIWDRSGKRKSVKEYFKNKAPVETEADLRGRKEIIRHISARLTVQSHGVRFTIIAMKYEGEADYRYLAATELTWRSIDIIRAYALRWLIEVVNFDWKQHDGWGRKAYQRGADGACRGMILSLLVDYFLLTHPAQIRQSRAGLPLWTAGSVVRRLQYDNMLNTIEDIFTSPDPLKALRDFAEAIERMVPLMPSTKHMVGIEISDLGPSPSLQRRYWS